MKNEQLQKPVEPNRCQPTNTLRIIGRLRKPFVIDMEALCAMETEEVKDLPIICGTGNPKGRIASLKGVPLDSVIRMADVIKDGHNDTKRMYIVASAADGYTVVFSWQEIFNSPLGEGILLLIERDGQSLCNADEGIQLISTKDYFTGSRTVMGLETIEVRMVE